MLTMKVYLSESGAVADLKKDFPLFQGQYNNILLNVFVPTSILAPSFKVLSQDYNEVVFPFVAGTGVKVACRTIARNGVYNLSESFYLRFVKTLTKDGISYALFERKLPKEFTTFAGQGEMIINAVNVKYGTIESATVEASNPELIVSVNEQTVKEKGLPIPLNYVFTYNAETTSWFYNADSVNLADFGITYSGTPNDQDTITLSVKVAEPTVINTLTSQTTALLVLPSSYLDKEMPIEASKWEIVEATLNDIIALLNLKQDKTDNGLQTAEKSVVGAINELNDQVQDNTENISGLIPDVEQLKSIVGTGENFIGTFRYQATDVQDKPSDNELLGFVRSVEGQDYVLKGGDALIVIQVIQGETDKNYKYIYNGSEWSYYEIPVAELSQNGVAGLVKGTYNIGSTNTILADIIGGEIRQIYVKGANGLYIPLSNINTKIEEIISGIIRVGYAQKSDNATNDELGNNIADTYMTQRVGASKQYVKEYALPKKFNDIIYINGSNTVINSIGQTLINRSVYELEDIVFELASKNSQEVRYAYSMQGSQTEANVYFRLETYIEFADSRPSVTLSTQITNTRSIEPNNAEFVTFSSPFDALQKGEVVGLTSGDKIVHELSIVRSQSNEIEISVSSGGDIFGSYFYLFTDSVGMVSGTVEQGTGTSTINSMSQKAVTEFGTPNNLDLSNTETRVSYDNESGATVTSIAEDIRENGDLLNYPTKFNVPYIVDGDLSADVNEDNTAVVITGASKLLISLVTPTQENGTLTEEQLAFLQSKDSNYIEIDDGEGHIEKYYYSTNATASGYRVYTHNEDEAGSLTVKAFTITESVRSWVITKTNISELLANKVEVPTSDLSVGDCAVIGFKVTSQGVATQVGWKKVYRNDISANSIAMRDGKRLLHADTPTESSALTALTTKQYVDEAVAGGGSTMWLHKVHIVWENNLPSHYDIFVSIVSSDSTPINTLELLKANVSKVMGGTFTENPVGNQFGTIYSAFVSQSDNKVYFMYTYKDEYIASYSNLKLDTDDVMEGTPITYTDTVVQL